MRVIIQRVTKSKLHIDNRLISEIGKGLMILVGIENADNEEDINWLVGKIVRLRIFPDEGGVMNLSVKEVGGEIMAISQFTLHASTKKGNRPSYIRAAKPEKAVPLYNLFIKKLENELGNEVKVGEFGAYMKIDFINDGPVTIQIDTKNKE